MGKTGAVVEAVLACVSYSVSSIALSLLNKLVFSGAGFDFPLAILAFQSLCAVVCLKGGDVVGATKPLPLDADLFRRMTPVTLLFCAMLWSSGKALRFCSMPLLTVFKNLAVVGTTAWEFVRFGTKVSCGIIFSLALMVAGSAIAGSGDMTATPMGLLWLTSNVVITVAYLAAVKELMPADASSGAKTLHNNILTLVLFTASAAAGGELVPFCERLAEQSTGFQVGVVLTGIMGTFLNLSTFWCMKVASGATYAFVGACNKIPLAFLGHWLFHSVITDRGWAGVCLGLAAGIVYAMTKERERRRANADSRLGVADSTALAEEEAEGKALLNKQAHTDNHADGHGCASDIATDTEAESDSADGSVDGAAMAAIVAARRAEEGHPPRRPGSRDSAPARADSQPARA